MNIYWEAEKYKENFSFVHRYGEDVLDLICKPKGRRVPLAVDLGCGNGALTERLANEGYRVIGIDDSEQMLETARKLHPDLDFRKGNAVDFTLAERADVIFSNAVFHWIDAVDQERMAQNIFSQLRPGGQLVCEFGGKGCAETVHSALEGAFANMGLEYSRVFYFPTIGEYTSVLEKAGFRVEYACLFDRPTPQSGEDGLVEWIEMFVKRPFEGMSAEDKAAVLDEVKKKTKSVLFKDGIWIVDYVRIRIRAVRPM